MLFLSHYSFCNCGGKNLSAEMHSSVIHCCSMLVNVGESAGLREHVLHTRSITPYLSFVGFFKHLTSDGVIWKYLALTSASQALYAVFWSTQCWNKTKSLLSLWFSVCDFWMIHYVLISKAPGNSASLHGTPESFCFSATSSNLICYFSV